MRSKSLGPLECRPIRVAGILTVRDGRYKYECRLGASPESALVNYLNHGSSSDTAKLTSSKASASEYTPTQIL